MSTITTIQSTDAVGDSRSVINTNFDNLNTDKIEARLRLRTSSQSLWEAFVLYTPVFVRESDQKVIPFSYQEVLCILE